MDPNPAEQPDRTPVEAQRIASDVIRVKDQFYILATSTLADDRRRVLKQGETFAVFDHFGDVRHVGQGEGIYHEGTRFLSSLILRLGTKRPMLLSSTIREDNALLAVDLTNPDVEVDDRVAVPRGTIHLARRKFLWRAACHEKIHVRNFGLAPVEATLSVHFEADFADIFEVRGTSRNRKGLHLDPAVGGDDVVLSYEGLDKVVRRARIAFDPAPESLSGSEARFRLVLEPGGEADVTVALACEVGGRAARPASFDEASAEAAGAVRAGREHACDVYTTNERFNEWINRSAADLWMLATRTPEGWYPYAGVPWFSTAFGRDGIITAMECLWIDPEMSRGVLGFLAANQADRVSPGQDAEPGKILHETRKGEMAALGEIPFGRYYGSVDSTPLFIMLAAAYLERTGDEAFLADLWPNVERALAWIDEYGDRDGDGFVEYHRQSEHGLAQQGWKDSQDSVSHADGRLAEGPIALCEVQGYVYAAKQGAARIAEALKYRRRADELAKQAKALRVRFEQAFWLEDLGIYALALDGEKRPCRVVSSNAGHCLWTGIASPERARRVASTLLGPDCFGGWGIRTLSAREARYNPMSYHNGSVWPHDNALIAQGFARYGLKEAAVRVLTGLFDASLFVDLNRMPELFCGFPRRPGEGPTLYPVACAPQAWSAAAVYLVLGACLGLTIEGPRPDERRGRVGFRHPLLPESLREARIRNLRVGRASVDLLLERHEFDVGVNVLRREGDVEVVVVK